MLALLGSPVAQASVDTIRTQSGVEAVTVFFSGAVVERHAVLKLQKGKQVVQITALPRSLKPESIQLSGVKQATILVVKHGFVTPERPDDPKQRKVLEAEEKAIIRRNQALEAEMDVLHQEENILLQNANIAKRSDGTTVTALREAADFYRLRLGEIRKMLFANRHQIEANQEQLKEIYRAINSLKGPVPQEQSQIFVTLEARRDFTDTLIVKYFDQSAGWKPTYDFRVNDLRQPLQISYLAEVFQFTGEDWKQVKLVLSNTNPTLSGDKPILKPWYFGRAEPRIESVSQYAEGFSAVKGKVLDQKQEGIPFANVVLKQDNFQLGGTTSDVEGNYSFSKLRPGNYDLHVSYVGYHPAVVNNVRLYPDKITYTDLRMAEGIALKEINVMDYQQPLISKDETSTGATYSQEEISRTNDLSIRGSRNKSGEYFIDGIRVRGNTNMSGSITGIDAFLPKTPELLMYHIENRQTILGDGENQRVPIKDEKVKARYVHHAVPKLSNDVFLIAEIAPWSQLNLLDGKASLYYQGTFVGETEVRSKSTGDTLSLGLGRDRSIVLERRQALDQESRKYIGNNIKQQLKWEITIRNNKDFPVELLVEDQLPISKNKSVEIEHQTLPAAALDEATGLLKWQLVIPGGEKTLLKLNYSVKFPASYGMHY